jgi:hypothetical protein
MSTMEQLIHEALNLPLDQRERLTEELDKSIHVDAAHGAESGYREAWSRELAERMAAADRGEFAEGDWRDVIDRSGRSAES